MRLKLLPYYLTAICLALTLMPSSLAAESDRPRVVDGVFDLRDWNIDHDGGLQVIGNWRFDWQALIGPGDAPQDPQDTFLAVPGVWNGKTVNGQPIDGCGFGTYRLTILLPPDSPPLHLGLPEFHMASRLWANGELIFEAGQVGRTREEEIARSVPATVALPRSETVDLVLQMSNFYHMEGGIPRVINLDRSDRILGNANSRLLINVFTIGALVFLGLHYLVIFINQPRNREHLLYALLAFLMLIRLAVVNKLTYLLGDHPHVLSTRLSYTTVFLVPTLYVMFLHTLFPLEFNRRLAQLLVAAGLVGTAVVWLTPPHFFTWVRDTSVVIIQALVLYAIIMTILACLRRREDSVTVLVIVLIFGLSIIYDTLLYQGLLYSNDISSYGFLVFIFGHAAILGRRSNRAEVQEREARQALAEITQNLKERVVARTAALAEAKDAAEQALLAKSRFLNAASHDLRQPLHAINLFAGMLETSIRQGTWPKAVAKITQSLQGLDKFLVDLGEMGRLESGVLEPRIKSVSLQTFFEVLFDELEPECRVKGLELTFVRTTVWVRTDPDMFGRMLRNLVSNAIKYTESGRVVVGCRRLPDGVRVEVHDTGCGFEENESAAIFEEFYRVNSSRGKATGVGLGLSIVKHTAGLLGHRLEVSSVPGQGSCFSLLLARVKPPDLVVSDDVEETENESLEGLVVLFVDDDETICSAMEDVFIEWGCTILTANSAGEAEAVVEGASVAPDLLVSDFRFVDEDNGLRVAERVFAAIGSEIPVLIITAETSQEQIGCVADRGFPMLFKPVNVHELRRSVCELVAAWQLVRCEEIA